MDQQTFAALDAGPTQAQCILSELERCPGRWVSLPDLCRVSGAYAVHSRISDLRALGHSIENKCGRVGRTVTSWYRLVPSQPATV